MKNSKRIPTGINNLAGAITQGYFKASLLIILGMNLTALGQPYYVSPTGNNSNSGTLTEPWQTIQKAANSLAPGDTVYVRGGVYNEAVTLNVSGSAGNGSIVFQNYANEIPILDGSGLVVAEADNGMILIVDQHHIIIKGFEIRNYSSTTPFVMPVGINIRGVAHHIQLRNNHIHHIATNAPVDGDLMGADAHGIAVYGTSAIDSINNIIIDGNELNDLTLGSSEGLVLNGNVAVFTVSHNIVHDCNNIGIDFIGFEDVAPSAAYDQARNGNVVDNIIYNISSYGNPAYGNEYSAGGIYVDGGRNIIVERNTVSQADIGIEIASEHQGRATNFVTVRNNFLFNNRMAGISMGGYDDERGSTENCIIVNNSLYYNGIGENGNQELLLQFDTRYNIIKNNIFYADEQSLLIGNPFSENVGNIIDYNIYFCASGQTGSEWEWKNNVYEGFAAYISASGNDTHSLFIDPQYTGLSVPDLHLLTTSPAINAGENLAEIGDYDIDGETRLLGSNVDIGADEFSATTSSFGVNTNSPEMFVLNTNYPNPFNPSTTLSYGIPEAATVSLVIYDLRGKTIKTLVSGSQTTGWYHYSWHGQNQNGEQVCTGLYFARLQANDFSQVIELVYLR